MLRTEHSVRELFIYYRVHPAQAAAALDAVQQMQLDLMRRHPGLTARLLRREPEVKPEATADALQTWMETYSLESNPEGVTPALQADVAALGGALDMIQGPRRVEVFVDLIELRASSFLGLN
jgi:ABC-type nitrate/sulfonate/bicarbonate transport system substrate-binding protein